MQKEIVLALGALLCASLAAQAPPPKKENVQRKPPLPVFEIVLSEDTDYPSLSWPNKWVQENGVESHCIGDGSLYVLRPGQGLVSFTSNGIVSFLTDKMTDIPNPNTTWDSLNPAISPSGVSFVVIGIDDAKIKSTTSTDDEGHTHVERDATNATATYIARFDKDGTYKSAIKLELPFRVFKFAAFESGNLVAQGPDRNDIPRMALLDSSAEFLRYLDLRKDLSTSKDASPEDIKCVGCTADVASAVSSSFFTPWKERVLFKRELTGKIQVYEIQESGDARLVNIKSPEGYDVGKLVPSDRNWLLRFNKTDGKGDRPDTPESLLEVDPQTGEPLREYHLRPEGKLPQTVVSCFAEGEFWGVRRDAKEQKLRVVRGTATPYRGK